MRCTHALSKDELETATATLREPPERGGALRLKIAPQPSSEGMVKARFAPDFHVKVGSCWAFRASRKGARTSRFLFELQLEGFLQTPSRGNRASPECPRSLQAERRKGASRQAGQFLKTDVVVNRSRTQLRVN
jgi:hypothetical protein